MVNTGGYWSRRGLNVLQIYGDGPTYVSDKWIILSPDLYFYVTAQVYCIYNIFQTQLNRRFIILYSLWYICAFQGGRIFVLQKYTSYYTFFSVKHPEYL